MARRTAPAWVRKTKRLAQRSEEESSYHPALIAAGSAIVASLVTGTITIIGLQIQAESQQDQLQTQIDEDRETAQTESRTRAYAQFLMRSEAITARLHQFDRELVWHDSEDLQQRVKFIQRLADDIQLDIDSLTALKTQLMVIGPASLPFIAWDVADVQRDILGMKQVMAVEEAFEEANRSISGLRDEHAESMRRSRQLLRELEDELSEATNNLIVGVMMETRSDESANPDLLTAYIDRLNEQRARRAD